MVLPNQLLNTLTNKQKKSADLANLVRNIMVVIITTVTANILWWL